MPQPGARPRSVRQRQPTEVRRMLIVDAARTVIAERGLFATTVRDIAQAGEVSIGTLTYHFTGIAEILSEVLEGEMTGFYEPVVDKAHQADRGLDGLHILIDCFFSDDARTVQHWRLWLDFWSVSAHDARYADWQERMYRRWHDDVRALFDAAAEQGDITAASLDTAVSDFLTMYDGLAVQAYLPRSPLTPDAARRQLVDWMARTLLTEGEGP